MKKLLAAGLMLGAIALFCIAAVDTDKKDGFKVASLGGLRKDVKVKTDAGYTPVQTGKLYPYGTVIKTGRKSTADLELSPGNVVRLMPRSKLAIAIDTRNPKLRVLKLDKGTASIKLDKFPKGHKLQVETPTAVCGALGTRFTVSFEDDEDEKVAQKKTGTRENKISCEKGEIFASSSFTIKEFTQQGKTFNAPSITAGTTVVAKVHEGLENSYTDISVSRGSLTLDYGVKKGASFTLEAEEKKPARFVCALAKSDDDVEAAVMEVKSGNVKQKRRTGFFIKTEKLTDLTAQDGPLLLTENKTMKSEKAPVVGQYLAAAKAEAEMHSKLVAAGKDPAADKDLKVLAAKATLLRKELLAKRTRKLLQQIRRSSRRATQRIRR